MLSVSEDFCLRVWEKTHFEKIALEDMDGKRFHNFMILQVHDHVWIWKHGAGVTAFKQFLWWHEEGNHHIDFKLRWIYNDDVFLSTSLTGDMLQKQNSPKSNIWPVHEKTVLLSCLALSGVNAGINIEKPFKQCNNKNKPCANMYSWSLMLTDFDGVLTESILSPPF